jgi:hypothetical protein
MTANAKNPDRVFDKARECRFFLVQMAEYEKVLDIEKFLYCLSAFLSAFRTTAYRLYGVTENRKGKSASHALQNQLHTHTEIGFLIQRSNVEVHEDGVLVHQRFTVHVTASIPDRWKSNWAPDTDRWPNRFTSRFGDVVGIRRALGWQFAGNPKNLIELCHDALNAMEEYARQALVSAPSATQPVQTAPTRQTDSGNGLV